MVYYYLAHFAGRLGQPRRASEYYRLAASMPPDYVFPFEHEAIQVLWQAMRANPSDARAPYYLGNLLFDWQPEEAVKLWESSASLDAGFPIVHRNLAVAYSHRDEEGALKKAVASLERAVSLPNKYPMHFFELDQLYEAAGTAPEKRLAVLEKNHNIILGRDDALSRAISLKVNLGKYDEAIELLKGREFNTWEGGARFNTHGDWTDAHLLRGHQRLAAKRHREALADYQAALQFPENLRAERREGSGRQPEVAYWIGAAHEALGDAEKARQSWQASTSAELARARGGGDVLSERGVQLYYQALSLRRLGRNEKVEAILKELVAAGDEAARQESSGLDFFSAFGERQSRRARVAMAHYIAGLGYLGLNEKEKAKQEMTRALEISPDHLGAKSALAGLGN